MLAGVREAPTTATAAGSSSGRFEQRAQGGDGRARIAPFGGGGAARWIEREAHVHALAVRLRLNLESRIAEDVEHRRVVRQRHRIESRDAVRCRKRGQALQQHRADPIPLEPVVDGQATSALLGSVLE
jgi:hypothetical protein